MTQRIMCMLDLTGVGGTRRYINAEKIVAMRPLAKGTKIYLEGGHYFGVSDEMYDIEQALTKLFDYRTVDVSEAFDDEEKND